jgi:hypothetical protein
MRKRDGGNEFILPQRPYSRPIMRRNRKEPFTFSSPFTLFTQEERKDG